MSGDPRKVGETWRSRYWRTTYTVLAVDGETLTVRWADGTTTVHQTAIDGDVLVMHSAFGIGAPAPVIVEIRS